MLGYFPLKMRTHILIKYYDFLIPSPEDWHGAVELNKILNSLKANKESVEFAQLVKLPKNQAITGLKGFSLI